MRRASSFLLVSAAFAAATAASGATPALRAASPQPAAATPTAVAPKIAAVAPKAVVAVHHAVAKAAVRKHVAYRHVAAAHGISVPMDEVRVIQFSSPVSTVYVGNPSIADVSMIDNRHAFVLGKGFGGTNVVALNSDGKQVVNEAIGVYARTGSTVTLMRGANRTTLACGGSRCENAPMPGDDKDTYDVRMGQIEKHQDMNIKAASEGH